MKKKTILKKLSSKRLSRNVIYFLIVIAFFLGFFANKLTDIKFPFLGKSKEVVEKSNPNSDLEALQAKVIKESYLFKIKWGDLGKKMIEDGVIDKTKLSQAVSGADELSQELEKYLSGNENKIELSQANAQFWVDVLWGLGLANKNSILENGAMVEGGNTANFASTGGWTLGKSQAMDYYSKFSYISLTPEEQKRVEKIAGNIYRPCCGNSTAFPDCNHGMAALGLVELMVSQQFSDEEIYKTVLAFNTYWFPQTYLDTAYYFEKNGKAYETISPKELLSKTFSSASGYQVIRKKIGNVQWPALKGGGSCGA